MKHLPNICTPMEEQAVKDIWQYEAVDSLPELQCKNVIKFVKYKQSLK